ncbi:MAG: hypothetical protein WA840_07855, partial [Caulobacteraceae bacterium]
DELPQAAAPRRAEARHHDDHERPLVRDRERSERPERDRTERDRTERDRSSRGRTERNVGGERSSGRDSERRPPRGEGRGDSAVIGFGADTPAFLLRAAPLPKETVELED